MNLTTINPNPGDDFCNLTEDELLIELRRGLDWAFRLEDELQAAHSHASLAARRLRELHETVPAA